MSKSMQLANIINIKQMKGLIVILLVLPFNLWAVQENLSPKNLFEIGNKHYIEGNYDEAIKHYEAIIAKGKVSPELYFNLGNAYFKTKNIPYAILNYERAYLLNPGDEDIRFNLELARTYAIDKIDALPEFFLLKLIKSLIIIFSSNTWAFIAISSFFMTLLLLTLFMFSGSYYVKKRSFLLSILLSITFIASLSFSIIQKNRVANSNYAIITTSAVSAKSSPSETSSDLFILHAGTKVETLRQVGNWYEVRIPDGNKGWLPKKSFEKI